MQVCVLTAVLGFRGSCIVPQGGHCASRPIRAHKEENICLAHVTGAEGRHMSHMYLHAPPPTQLSHAASPRVCLRARTGQ
jgi:hypothetical protein